MRLNLRCCLFCRKQLFLLDSGDVRQGQGQVELLFTKRTLLQQFLHKVVPLPVARILLKRQVVLLRHPRQLNNPVFCAGVLSERRSAVGGQ